MSTILYNEATPPLPSALDELIDATGAGSFFFRLTKSETLDQTATPSTPVAALDDPVGYAEEMLGKGNDATQATTGLRGLWKVDGVEFDGIDDFLNTNNPPTAAATLLIRVKEFYNPLVNMPGTSTYAGARTSAGARFFLGRDGSTNRANFGFANQTLVGTTGYPAGRWVVAAIAVDAASARGYLNGTERAFTDSHTGTHTTAQNVFLGAINNNGSAASFSRSRIASAILADWKMTADEVAYWSRVLGYDYARPARQITLSTLSTLTFGQDLDSGTRTIVPTGLAKTPEGQYLVGDHGAAVAEGPQINPGVVVYTSALVLVNQWTVGGTWGIADPETYSVQGVHIDPAEDGTAWALLKKPGGTPIVMHFNYTTGAEVERFTGTSSFENGIMVDDDNGLVFTSVTGSPNRVFRRLKSGGTLLTPGNATAQDYDGLFYLGGNRALGTYGPNDVAGKVDLLDMTPFSPVVLTTFTLEGSLAIEGIVLDEVGGEKYFRVANDMNFHPPTAPAVAEAQIRSYRVTDYF